MIFGDNREAVIKNIQKAANKRDFTAKAEIGDPQMTINERLKLVNDYWKNRKSFSSKINTQLFLASALLKCLGNTLPI